MFKMENEIPYADKVRFYANSKNRKIYTSEEFDKKDADKAIKLFKQKVDEIK